MELSRGTNGRQKVAESATSWMRGGCGAGKIEAAAGWDAVSDPRPASSVRRGAQCLGGVGGELAAASTAHSGFTYRSMGSQQAEWGRPQWDATRSWSERASDGGTGQRTSTWSAKWTLRSVRCGGLAWGATRF